MVEEKLKTLQEIDCWLVERIGELFGDQFRQDSNIIPRLEAVETKIEKLIDILEKVIQHVS